MTTSSISQVSPVQPVQSATASAAQTAIKQAAATQKPDSVHLSAAAKAASGDKDHDGDSH